MELTPTTIETYLRHPFHQMLAVAERLGDALVNERPVGPTTNAVSALIIHCCGVTEFWLGHVALGRPSTRDRDREFSRAASVAELRALVESTIATALADVAKLEAGEGTDEGGRQFLIDGDTSDGSVVVHVLEELYQHLGHMDLTADVLLAR